MTSLPLTITEWRTAQRNGDGLANLLLLLEQEEKAPSVAWISLATPSQIRTQWSALQSLGTEAQSLPLYGVPFAAKDNIDATSFVTTAACPTFSTTPALEDSGVITRLKHAGAILVGKTNLDQFATGLVGTRSPYGAVPNAFDPEYVSGGSSSGSAVVVSRGVVPFSLGTDTAGSGRVPAGFNNVVGLKPTRGALSARGVVPACRTLDCVSIFALTVEDAEIVLSAAEGFDVRDAYSRNRPESQLAPSNLTDPVVAVCSNPPWFDKTGQEEPYNAAIKHAHSIGWRITPVDFAPLFALAQLLYEGPWVAERYQAIRTFIESIEDDDTTTMDPVVRGIVNKARSFNAVDAFASEYRRRDLTREIELAFEPYDVLLVPTAPTFPTIADVAKDPVRENSLLGTYTNFVNFLDWTAISVPAGFRGDGLPFGVTIIARTWREDLLLALARRWSGDEPRFLGATGKKAVEPKNTPDTSSSSHTGPENELVPIVVVGAHLSGLPLNKDLVNLGAKLVEATQTSAHYRLFALEQKPGSTVQKPGLKRITPGAGESGEKIAVEVWNLPSRHLATFMATIPHPLGIGSIELDDGTWRLGFICEPAGLENAVDVTEFGGWRAYTAHRTAIAATGTSRSIQRVLIANRGEIALRIIRTLRKMGLTSISIYADADATSPHAREADISLSLGPGSVSETYLDSSRILSLAASASADAIIPGYGFLSENAEFATAVEKADMVWIGPTPDQMRRLGLKHEARAIAVAANVPVVPGSEELLTSIAQTVDVAAKIGYPVMLKSTAGGGGIGLRRCDDETQLVAAFESVKRLAEANFGDAGVFVERFISSARHVEVQIVGDGKGNVWTAGERDCSLQRRHQKLIEESPAPGLPQTIRDQMRRAAVSLAASVQYRNVGTVEFIYEHATNAFYFLEVNARLQVEHGVTESVTGLDLVEVMVRVAEGTPFNDISARADTAGAFPVDGASIEVRVYAESPLQQFRPCVGKISELEFPSGVRVDTWVEKGMEITSLYDPLVAKIIATAPTRDEAVKKLLSAVSQTRIVGVETNLDYLAQILSSPAFAKGEYSTNLLDTFAFHIPALEVLSPGPASTIQDYPGRKGLWHVGIPPSGPMDDYSFRLANRAVGNASDAAAIEATLEGPTLLFHSEAYVAVTGATAEILTLDDEPISQDAPFAVRAGQTLRVGAAKTGYRFYVAIRGGIDVPLVLGSRSTFELGNFGGHNGRKLRRGDILRIGTLTDTPDPSPPAKIPRLPFPSPSQTWTIPVLPGPHSTTPFFTPSSLAELFTNSTWKIHYNANRLGIRLSGPRPKWARESGGSAGLHPSNIHDAPYSIGSVSFTGDEAVILGRDGPSLGGFVVFCVVVSSEMWRLGQVRPGDAVRFVPVSPESALKSVERMERCISDLEELSRDTDQIRDIDRPNLLTPTPILESVPGILADIGKEGRTITARQAGDSAILLEFGATDTFDIQESLAIYAFLAEHEARPLPYVEDLTPGVRTLHVSYKQGIPQSTMLSHLAAHDFQSPRHKITSVPSREILLPICFNDEANKAAIARYSATIRPKAPYLPSNTEFLRTLNGLPENGVEDILRNAQFLVLGRGDVFLGSPCAVPLDPRHRLFGTKYNPSRSTTPTGAVGIGGQYLCIYAAESPGGYQLVGRTLPIWNEGNLTSHHPSFPPSPGPKPWSFNLFDRISFYEVPESTLNAHMHHQPLTTHPLVKINHASLNIPEYESWLAEIDPDVQRIAAHRAQAIKNAPFLEELLSPPTSVINSGKSSDELFRSADTGDDERSGARVVRAGIPGRCFKCAVSEGDVVKEGDDLLWIESNKMEIRVACPVGGRVVGVRVEAGDLVMPEDALVLISL